MNRFSFVLVLFWLLAGCHKDTPEEHFRKTVASLVALPATDPTCSKGTTEISCNPGLQPGAHPWLTPAQYEGGRISGPSLTIDVVNDKARALKFELDDPNGTLITSMLAPKDGLELLFSVNGQGVSGNRVDRYYRVKGGPLDGDYVCDMQEKNVRTAVNPSVEHTISIWTPAGVSETKSLPWVDELKTRGYPKQ